MGLFDELAACGIVLAFRDADTQPDGEGELHLEVAIIPVSDVDRSTQFYERLGWRFDEDVAPMDGLRIVQFTPPGSGCSITFGIGVTTAAPGSAASTLTASDIVSTHKERAIQRGARRINGVPARTDRAGCRSPGAIQRPRRHPVLAEGRIRRGLHRVESRQGPEERATLAILCPVTERRRR
ncbi:MAG: hypothetical protein QOI50_882 [Pseudonocardiales bacterium]|nr:hypothetical protein [Pseudonocardiales bacterium]